MTAVAARQPVGALRGVVFDLDGTLIMSIEAVRAALNQALAAYGLRPLQADEMLDLVGHGARTMIDGALRLTGGVLSPAEHGAFLSRYTAAYMALPPELTTVFPGVPQALSALHSAGITLGVCTNKPHDLAMAALGSAGLLETFKTVIGGDVLAVRKPDPEHLLATLRAMAVPAAQAVYVGDNEVDILTANRAGIPIVLLNHGSAEPPLAGADVVLGGFDELVPALGRLRPLSRSS